MTLVAVAAYLTVAAVHSLVGRRTPEGSLFANALAGASVLVLTPLAYGKLRLARALGSRSLHGDGVLSGAGAFLSGMALTGLVINGKLGWWWADAVAALAMAVLLLAEAFLVARDPDRARAGPEP